MSPPPPHIKYTCWASADKWRPGFVILGANVNAIPVPPPSEIIVGSDGFWGANEWTIYPQPYRPEYPYLPWIPLRSQNPSTSSSEILTRPVQKTMWQSHSQKSNMHVVTPALLVELSTKWETIRASVQEPFQTISSTPSFSSVQHPMHAYFRATATLNRLGDDFEAWWDFVEVYRNLQRSLLELSAFLDWWKDVSAGSNFQPSIRPPTRGAIFDDERLYADHARYSVGAFLLIRKSSFSFDPAKEVALSPRKPCKEQLKPFKPIVHSLHLWYYPPLVQDIVDLETAARGYAERLDTFNPTKGFKRKLDKVKDKMSDETGRNAKMAKITMAIPSNIELKRLTDAGPAPVWFPKIHGVWKEAMNNINPLDLAATTPPRRFSLPPIHLFWGGNEQNQRTFFYHFFLLHTAIRDRTRQDLPPLTTAEWRSVLGNSYWKRQWANHERNAPSHDNTFDPSAFWRYGGPLFFGNELSVRVIAGQSDPTARLPCGCFVRLETADEPLVRQAALYHLNRLHTFEEIKQMERIQFPDDFESRWPHRVMYVESIMELWSPCDGQPAPGFFHNKEIWRAWLWAVRHVVADWDGFDRWDWYGLSNVRVLGINKLSTQDFRRFTVRLLTFFIHSFVTRLGYFPSALLCPPTFATHYCSEHLRKFGYEHLIFPLSID